MPKREPKGRGKAVAPKKFAGENLDGGFADSKFKGSAKKAQKSSPTKVDLSAVGGAKKMKKVPDKGRKAYEDSGA